MTDRINLKPIRTSNLIATYGFGFNADFKIHLSKSPKHFWKYIEEVKIILMKYGFKDWNIHYDSVRFGKVIIYNRNIMQNVNNVTYNLRSHGDSITKHKPPAIYYWQARQILLILLKKFPLLYFYNNIPSMVVYPYLSYKHKTPYQL